ncbi:MAG: 5-oxoprolinase subunit PxpB [Boseongicola sp. SB0677_bin_26]|nr:5-oxoprolinase subunit PxpB [Boseongicola sp. SB0665_bin_10]MYG28221.1 5-oxoprolinase subunit PxpB [Boseongicola sp. SB0677_bin_26]
MQEDCEVNGPVIRHLGDTALSVEFGNRIDAELVSRVHAFDAALNQLCLAGVMETVPTYRATTVIFDPLTADVREIEAAVLRLASTKMDVRPAGQLWEVPVAYGQDFGIDLVDVAAHAGMSPGDLIEAHAGPEYSVAMVGFLPGFSYLLGLDPRLSTPRRSEPRARIPASSISIGGQQTAIGSLEGPSGWHVIGRTPARPFHPGRMPEFLFEPGDRIRFRPISAREWSELDRGAARGALVAERVDG